MKPASDKSSRLSPAKRALLERWRGGADIALPDRDTIPRRKNQQLAALSFSQQRLWLFDQFQPNSSLYNMAWAIRIRGPLNVPVLERCFQELVRRHEALRTTFPSVDGRPVQRIAPPAPFRLSVRDLRRLPSGQRLAEVESLAAKEAVRPFDLSTGPLIRASLLQIDPHDHALLLTMHHIVSDAWSQNIFWRELHVLYTAFSAGKPSPLAELPIQYADFAVWQRDRLDGEELQRQVAYWRTQLAGVPPILELPSDFPRGEDESFEGAWQVLGYSDALSQQLQDLARRERCTLFMTLLAAFQTLLHRYTGRDDIVVGVPFANRNRSETEGLVGFFVNTLPLRTSLAGDPTFRQLLSRAREAALGAQAHEDIPFEKIVEQVKPDRVLGRLPLAQVTFNLVPPATQKTVELGDLAITRLDTGFRPQMDFDFSLDIIEQDRQICASYKTQLFQDATVRRMLQHFRTLLGAIASDPGRHLSQLPMLSAPERHQLLNQWNDTAREYPRDVCVQQMFEDQVERSPDAVALEFDDRQMSYRQLNQRSNQLAHHLRTLGAGPETPVGICFERSPAAVVAMLGVLKAGGAYVPLDPALPRQRLASILRDASPPLLLSHQQAAASLPDHDAKRCCLDSDWDVIRRHSKENPTPIARGDHLALVIYTSGTTGEPKGVMLVHCALSNHMRWMQSAYPLTEADAMLQKYSLSFDAGTLETLAPLLAGARLVIAPPGRHRDPSYLVELMAARKVTAIDLVPSLLEMLLEEEGLETCGDLRRITCGGEALSAALRDRCLARLSVELANLYGPTEGTIGSTYWDCRPDGPRFAVPIGRPIANTKAYVLDEYLNPVPTGVFGELCIAGVCLARGYLNRPELTAEKFIPNPYGAPPGARLYKTGDRARFRPDGSLEIAGRIDRQVKIRGYRIEPDEIESVLKQHPDVRDAAVTVRKAEVSRLAAYVVWNRSTSDVRQLREHVRDRVPAYMVPSAFVVMDALPRTASGKLDEQALPAPAFHRPDLAVTYQSPRTRVEQTLAEIWRDVLHVEKVGVDDNFFELGGDSILSIQIVVRAKQAGLRLSPKDLFEHPTVAQLAAVAGSLPASETRQVAVTGDVPLTPIQCWFLEREFAEPHHHNQAFMLQANQDLDPRRLETAAGHLLRHHDALRLRYQVADHGWKQRSLPPGGPVPWTRVDLAHVPDAKLRTAIEARAADQQASLNLQDGPLVRWTLFETGSGRPDRLLMVVHHLAVDAVSWQILIEDLESAYKQLGTGPTVRLPPKSDSFKTWSLRLNEYAQTKQVEAELDYWLSHDRAPMDRLPSDDPSPDSENRVGSASQVLGRLTTQETEALLREVPRAYDVQINDALLTALLHAFTLWTGQPRLLLDLEGHGREDLFDDVDVSRTVGWFTTMYPVLLAHPQTAKLSEVINAVKDQLSRIPQRGIGYGLLRYLKRDATVSRKLRALPQPQVSFNYLGQLDRTFDGKSLFAAAGESCGPMVSPRARRSHLIEVNCLISAKRLQVVWIYSPHTHRPSTITKLSERFCDALRSMVADRHSGAPQRYTPSDFSLIDSDQNSLDRLIAKKTSPS